MQLDEALQQIGEIRAHVARAETFRGYRSATVGTTGVLALFAAAGQSLAIPRPLEHVAAYLILWVVVATISVVIVGVELAWRYLRSFSELERQNTARAVEQFMPCMIAGAAVTCVVIPLGVSSVVLLPGIWSVLFSMGVFASWRQLPPASFWVGIYYLAAGLVCLVWAREAYALSPWAMAGSFGVGQLLTAAVLFFSLERTHATPRDEG